MKSLDRYHSASLKRQREMSAVLNRGPGTSAQSEENQVSASTTTQVSFPLEFHMRGRSRILQILNSEFLILPQ